MYLISVYFDKKTNDRIESYIRQVAKRSGNTFMTEKNVPPHLTISAFETRNEKKIIALLEEKKSSFQSGELTWCSVGTFFPHVIYAAPVLNLYLQDLSEKVYEMLCEIDGMKIHGCYRPMQWFPHTTLGKKLSKEEMIAAFRVMQEQFGMFSGQAVRIGLARTNPYEELWEFQM